MGVHREVKYEGSGKFTIRNKGDADLGRMEYTQRREYLSKNGKLIKERLRYRKYKPQPVNVWRYRNRWWNNDRHEIRRIHNRNTIGGKISPLLENIMLNDMDREIGIIFAKSCSYPVSLAFQIIPGGLIELDCSHPARLAVAQF